MGEVEKGEKGWIILLTHRVRNRIRLLGNYGVVTDDPERAAVYATREEALSACERFSPKGFSCPPVPEELARYVPTVVSREGLPRRRN